MGTSFAEVLFEALADGAPSTARRVERPAPSPFADAIHGFEARVAEAAVAAIAPDAPAWARVLGVSAHASEGEVLRAFRRRAFELHPDRGGSHEAFLVARRALDEGLAALGSRGVAVPTTTFGTTAKTAYGTRTAAPARARRPDVTIIA